MSKRKMLEVPTVAGDIKRTAKEDDIEILSEVS